MPSSKTTFPYKKEKGPNGLRAIYVPMKNTKTVAVLVMVGVGSRYETKSQNGISHFLEHMMFKGTEKRPTKREIAQELDAVGASYNAFTDKEMTGYYVKTDAAHAELAMDVVSDIFLHSTVPAAEIEKERGVILGEIDMYEDLPMRKVNDIFEELLYPNQPLGWDIAGRKEVIRRLKQKDFLSYREKYYRASNTVVVVAGNISQTKARSLVKKYFEDIPKGRVPKPLPVKEKQSRPQVKLRPKKTDQTHLIVGCRAYDRNDPRRWPLALLGVVLGGNMSSRLFIRVRDELGLGYYIRAGVSLGRDQGYFEVSAGVESRRTEEAIEAIIEELRRAKKGGISEQEFTKARDYIRGSTLLSLESADELGMFYGTQELLARKILTPEQTFRMINKVTQKDVKKIAREVFQSRKVNLAFIGPHTSSTERKMASLLTL